MTAATSARSAVLVVEDDPDIRGTLCDVIADEGYLVAAAADGQEALARLAEMVRPGLILLDLMMPIMDGSEFLAALRGLRDFASLPVVVVSAWPDEARHLRHEIQGFLKKPVALNALMDTIARFCSADKEAPATGGL